jgi:SAM-dependent methyltransferase
VTATDGVAATPDAGKDDWDHHWDVYGEAAQGNPANDYRRALVLRLLGRPPAGSVVLDIGSGQGQFALQLRERYRDVEVRGVEHSASGVARSRTAAAEAGLEVAFTQRDLLRPTHLEPGEPAATHAVCSEVLEHVDEPTLLMRNAIYLLAPGARVVVTVPGGPRSAFDKHIGHRQHFTSDLLRRVLVDAGLHVDRVLRAGFPFFNLYKLAVIVRGKGLIRDVESRAPGAEPSRVEAIVTEGFRRGFALNRDDFRFGWQMAAVARAPGEAEATPSS